MDPAETKRLGEEALEHRGSPLGYFLAKAVESVTQRERSYWLARVDGARYMLARQEARDDLANRARENMEAEARLIGTEATLELVRTVGNAVVLRLVKGEKEPGGGYSLIRRKAGETGTTGYGAPSNDQWVIQGLQLDTAHEFAVVSEDFDQHKQLTGPWHSVPIGNVSTGVVQQQEQEEADRQYREAEEAEAERQRLHEERMERERQETAQRIKDQEAAAAAERARLAREQKERAEAREAALRNLPLVAPREMQMHLRDQGLPTMTLDVSFRRGERMPKYYKFELNDSVLGYSGEYDGVKPQSHIYRRMIELPRGQESKLLVAGVTEHGDAGEPAFIRVPFELTYRSDTGVLISADVGGGRYGFAARRFSNWHLANIDGRLDIAQQTGVTALWESTGAGGIMWVVAAHDRIEWVAIDGVRTLLTQLAYNRGIGYLYRGVPESWPSRDQRRRGVSVEVSVKQ